MRQILINGYKILIEWCRILLILKCWQRNQLDYRVKGENFFYSNLKCYRNKITALHNSHSRKDQCCCMLYTPPGYVLTTDTVFYRNGISRTWRWYRKVVSMLALAGWCHLGWNAASISSQFCHLGKLFLFLSVSPFAKQGYNYTNYQLRF